MKLGKWHQGTEKPKETGWYLRDYRNPPKSTDGELPPYSIDKFIKVKDGEFWYVSDLKDSKELCLNDAWYESLPWCKIKD